MRDTWGVKWVDRDLSTRVHMSVYRGWYYRTLASRYHARMWAQGNQSSNFPREARNEALCVKPPTSKYGQQLVVAWAPETWVTNV